MSSPFTMPSDQPRRRSFRHPSMTRKPSRRLFSRPSSISVTGISLPASASQQLSSKRSFLAKPPAPGAARRVLAVLRDGQKRRGRSPNESADGLAVREDEETAAGTGTDSVSSSLQLAGEGAAAGEGLIEVDASEVSDGSSSGRARCRSSASGRGGGVEDGMQYVDDGEAEEEGGGGLEISFRLVGEDDVPEAPAASALDVARVRALQGDVEALRKEKRDMEAVFAQQHRELNVLVNAMKTRAAESSNEVEELTRQLKETRKRLTRRVRELEEEVGKQRSWQAEEVARHKGVEKELRAEVDALRGNGQGQCFVRTESTPTLPARRKRASAAATAAHHPDTTRGAAPESVSSGGNSAQGANFARVRSAGNVQETLRRKTSRPDVYHSSVRASGLAKRASNASGEVGRNSPRTLARRSLLRRSFIAHIHSSRYRTTRSAWHEFLGAESTQVTPEQFARAVRSLAIASDARDRDLELLREEVCGAELGDTGVVTWEMFVRFYQRTKHEST